MRAEEIEEILDNFEEVCDLDTPMKFRPLMAEFMGKLRRRISTGMDCEYVLTDGAGFTPTTLPRFDVTPCCSSDRCLVTEFSIAVIESLDAFSEYKWALRTTIRTRMYVSGAQHTAWILDRIRVLRPLRVPRKAVARR